ncbi:MULTISPECIES: hypothetical protein [Bacteroidaceae]|jgi:hypothetical protein|uniref:Uncharacterized protein n=1 Tax=Bacteroides fragilis TaxID=817 RepID=A0A642KRV5_BACFG|nr:MULTISPECIES: hypothetical protein [Bacteroides]KAA5085442.1 hypothetical protein F2Z82_17930 [Bacteroides fragilis]KAA5087785.1 hypothetical protein F2Z45_17765 [Bacteroides fragilis]KAA5092460.1 hypothetical protein F2Z40_01075 [Bacteroides fragilis]KAA5097925.1 hypothetical protein F2Z46_17215 [Bacteroides fragilis]KAA5108238.1 hypothetical protein F2Z51_06430 [Bacteroides fragilis]
MNSSCSAIGFAWFCVADNSVGNGLNNRVQSYDATHKTLIRKTKRNGAIVTDRRENAENRIREIGWEEKESPKKHGVVASSGGWRMYVPTF